VVHPKPIRSRPLTDIHRRIRNLFIWSSALTVLVTVTVLTRAMTDHRMYAFDMAGLVLVTTGVLLLTCGLLGCLRYIDQHATPRMEKVTYRDEFTGLFTPQYFMTHIQTEISRACRYSTSFSVLYVQFRGLDKGEMGESGDRVSVVLRDAAAQIRMVLRQEDVAARWRDGSFVIFLPNTEFLSGYMVADRLEHLLASSAALHPRLFGQTASVGIGCATFPFDATDAAELIQLAQAAAARDNSEVPWSGVTARRPSIT
jgi:diguanylate cyclase (GGDEF)-like protein